MTAASDSAKPHTSVPQHSAVRNEDTLKAAAAKFRAMYFTEDLDAGIHESQALATQFPDATDIRAWLVLMLGRNNHSEDALKEADALNTAYPDDPWSAFALAGALNYAGGRDEEALTASERALHAWPHHPDMLWMRAETLRHHGHKADAIAFVDAHRHRVANPAELLVTKATTMYEVAGGRGGQPPDAETMAAISAVFAEARAADPSNPIAHVRPGIYYQWQGSPEAYAFLKRAVELAPYSTSIRRHYWWEIWKQRDKEATAKLEDMEQSMAALVRERGQYPGVLMAVWIGYEQQGLTDKQHTISERILRDFPASPEAEWMLVEQYRAVVGKEDPAKLHGTPKEAEYRRQLRAFLARPHHRQMTLLGDAYRSLFSSLKDDATTTPEDLLTVVQGMARYEGINPHVAFAQGAITLAERTPYFREAERIARDGIVEGTKKIDEQRDVYKTYKTQEEYDRSFNWMTAFMDDALGWVFFKEGRLADAERELTQAYQRNVQNRDNLYHLGQLYEAMGREERAEHYYLEGLAVQMPGPNPNEGALQKLYTTRDGNLSGIEQAKAKDREKRKAQVFQSRLPMPEAVLPFELKRLDGTRVTLVDLKEKVVVINYWGIWCGWCVEEMPEFQQLHERYQHDPGVVVLTINNDRNPETVPPWMTQQGYTFPVLLDDGYAGRVNVHAFPTTWFLDRHGRIAFKKEGWTKELLEEFSWRIDVLKTDE